MQGRVVVAIEKFHDVVDGFERAAQVEQFRGFEVRVFRSDTSHRRAHIKEIAEREILVSILNDTKFLHLSQPFVHHRSVVGKADFIHLSAAQRRKTFAAQKPPNFGESNLALKVFRVNHCAKVRKKSEYFSWIF